VNEWCMKGGGLCEGERLLSDLKSKFFVKTSNDKSNDKAANQKKYNDFGSLVLPEVGGQLRHLFRRLLHEHTSRVG
jgi:hypothetical protein